MSKVDVLKAVVLGAVYKFVEELGQGLAQVQVEAARQIATGRLVELRSEGVTQVVQHDAPPQPQDPERQPVAQ